MKKSRLILAFMAVVATLTLATGCMFPDYGIEFDYGTVSINDPSPGYTTVDCVLHNVSVNDLTNVSITMEITAGTRKTATSESVSIRSGAYRTVSCVFYTGGTAITGEPRVIDVYWDTSSD